MDGPRTPQAWLIDLRAAPDEVQSLRGVLSPDERDREARFAFDDLRAPFVVAHAGLRLLLAERLDCAPSELVFRTGSYGKPHLVDRALEFNLSHSGSWALLALGDRDALGVDIEVVDALRATPSMIRAIGSRRERSRLDQLGGDARVAAFFRLWSRKEAAVKALGTGMSQPLDAIEVPLGPIAPRDGLAMPSQVAGAAQWCLWDLRAPPGYVAALVVRQTPGTQPHAPEPVRRIDAHQLQRFLP